MTDTTNEEFGVRTMPSCTIIPVLEYPDLARAIDWLVAAFGFRERWRVGNHRAQLSFGTGAIAISEAPEPRVGRLARHPRSAQSVLVRVPNVAEHYEQAKGSGAHILKEPADFPYGERQYTALDLGGHVWTFSESLADLAPEAWGGVSAPSGVERGR